MLPLHTSKINLAVLISAVSRLRSRVYSKNPINLNALTAVLGGEIYITCIVLRNPINASDPDVSPTESILLIGK